MSKKKRLRNEKRKSEQNKETADTSPVVYQKSKLQIDLHIINRILTPKQKQFIDIALDKGTKMMLVSGPAGTTKTYLAVLATLMLFNQKKVSDLLYVRSVVESADVKMGTLPGEADDKLSPYTRPLTDKLDELLPRVEIEYLFKEHRVEALPIGYLRGLNWNAKTIIGDEMQNCTRKELITLMTRTGEFSKVFLLGDPMQSDINSRSGFKEVFDFFDDEDSKQNGIFTFEFTEDDILRSALVRFIVSKAKKLAPPPNHH